MDQITSVSDFEYFRDKSVIIRTWKFNNTITVGIQVGDDWIPIMSGNFWDFYPGCKNKGIRPIEFSDLQELRKKCCTYR